MPDITFNDSQTLDAFGRLRTGSPFTLFKNIQNTPSGSMIWSERLVSGASTEFSELRASTTLRVTPVAGSLAIRQTRHFIAYQPGNSQLVMMTCIIGDTPSGLVKRIGFFNERNGIFFQMSGSLASWHVRSSVSGVPIETIAEQSSWNIDSFGATSAITSNTVLDFTMIQFFVIDFSWLGTGRIRVGFHIGGLIKYAHAFNFVNTAPHVYMSTPVLPVRIEIENVSGTASSQIEHVCTAVSSESGGEDGAQTRSASRANNPLNITDNNIHGLISITRASDRRDTLVVPKRFTVMSATGDDYRWIVLLRRASAASWMQVHNSSVRYDVSPAGVIDITTATIIDSGYSDKTRRTTSIELIGKTPFGSDLDGSHDEIVVAVQRLGSGPASFYGSITWHETN